MSIIASFPVSSLFYYRKTYALIWERAHPFERGRAPLGEGVPLLERARPFGRGRAPLGDSRHPCSLACLIMIFSL